MKEFNVTGTCIPSQHYMVDIRNKLDKIEKLVDKGKYFTISKPRQYGKTTTMFLLAQRLKNDYLVLKMSFEGYDQEIYKDQKAFIQEFLLTLIDKLEFLQKQNLIDLIEEEIDTIINMRMLSRLITKLIKEANKELVLMIDEVDKSSNNQLFLDFIAMLRNKYLLSKEGQDYTFKSVILAGVHDIKNLKLKLQPGQERKFNSPWNIAVDFKVDMTFNSEEISTMLEEYKDDRDAKMNVEEIAQEIYYYTSGHPFLVSKIAKIIDEDLDKKDWSKKDITKALKILLAEQNTNFSSLIKNIENNEDLYNLIHKIIMEGEEVTYNLDNPIIKLGELYGIFKNNAGIVKIQNKIYEQRIYNYLSSKLETSLEMTPYNFRDNFVRENDTLNFKKILNKFQLFIKEQYSNKDQDFLERNGRLLFLAFIKPIINGKGFDFKEVQISEEKRLDVVITYLDQKYVVELKIWRGEKYHQQGIKQLINYLDLQSVNQGYLITFNFNQNKKYKKEVINYKDKEIYAVWV